MITADTITDEQIRALVESAATVEQRRVAWTALEMVYPSTRGQVTEARARCAEILNARGGK